MCIVYSQRIATQRKPAPCNPLAGALTVTAFPNYRTLLINFVNCG